MIGYHGAAELDTQVVALPAVTVAIGFGENELVVEDAAGRRALGGFVSGIRGAAMLARFRHALDGLLAGGSAADVAVDCGYSSNIRGRWSADSECPISRRAALCRVLDFLRTRLEAGDPIGGTRAARMIRSERQAAVGMRTWRYGEGEEWIHEHRSRPHDNR